VELKGGIDLCPSKGQFSIDKIIVLKIGGSCLKNGISLRRSLKKVDVCIKEGYRPIIVLSALNGLTDKLLDIVNSNIEKETEISDPILSEGERLSTRIFKKILDHKEKRTEIIDIYKDRFPIIASKENGRVEINVDETRVNLKQTILPLIERGVIPLIPGYVGKTIDGKITTLGRGGSDTTAVLIGSLIEAFEVVLLKDVPGILRYDPEIKSTDKIIDKIDVGNAIELGRNGGDVINPDALEYKRGCTDIRIVDYKDDNFLEDGTKIIGEYDEISSAEVYGSKALVTLVSHSKYDLDSKYKTIVEDKIESSYIFRSNNSCSFCVDEKNPEETTDIIHEFVEKDEDTAICYEKGVAFIEIKSKSNLDLYKTFYNLYQEFTENSIRIINSKFESDELFIIVKCEDIEKINNILEVIG